MVGMAVMMVRDIAVSMVVMGVPIIVMTRANDLQAMVMSVLGHEPVQAVAEHRNAAVAGHEHKRQPFATCQLHEFTKFDEGGA
jgi:hypothetical protein